MPRALQRHFQHWSSIVNGFLLHYDGALDDGFPDIPPEPTCEYGHQEEDDMMIDQEDMGQIQVQDHIEVQDQEQAQPQRQTRSQTAARPQRQTRVQRPAPEHELDQDGTLEDDTMCSTSSDGSGGSVFQDTSDVDDDGSDV